MFIKLIRPLFLLFLITTILIEVFARQLQQLNTNTTVLLSINVLLFSLTIIVFLLLFKALKTNKANAPIHSIMLGVLLKFMVVAIATVIYAKTTATINKNAIYGGMILYIIYTYIETKIALKINKTNAH